MLMCGDPTLRTAALKQSGEETETEVGTKRERSLDCVQLQLDPNKRTG